MLVRTIMDTMVGNHAEDWAKMTSNETVNCSRNTRSRIMQTDPLHAFSFVYTYGFNAYQGSKNVMA